MVQVGAITVQLINEGRIIRQGGRVGVRELSIIGRNLPDLFIFRTIRFANRYGYHLLLGEPVWKEG